jgi:hypothetical protein
MPSMSRDWSAKLNRVLAILENPCPLRAIRQLSDKRSMAVGQKDRRKFNTAISMMCASS